MQERKGDDRVRDRVDKCVVTAMGGDLAGFRGCEERVQENRETRREWGAGP